MGFFSLKIEEIYHIYNKYHLLVLTTLSILYKLNNLISTINLQESNIIVFILKMRKLKNKELVSFIWQDLGSPSL